MIRSVSEIVAVVFVVLVFLGVGGAVIGTASAQDGGNYAGADADNRSTTIDSNTFLVSAEYSDADQTVTVKLRSEIDQEISVSDAGVFMVGGEIETRTVEADANSTVVLTIPVTETDNNLVAVGIETEQTAYAVPPFRTPREEQTNVFERTTSTAGWLGGASATLVMVGVSAYNKVRKRKTEPEELTENV